VTFYLALTLVFWSKLESPKVVKSMELSEACIFILLSSFIQPDMEWTWVDRMEKEAAS
jgi:hypothetical protein